MSAKQKDVGSSLTLDQFFYACNIGFVRLFSANFLMSPKGPPFNFLIFCNRMVVQKIPKRPPFTFSSTMRLTGDFKKISIKISGKKFSNFFHYFGIVRLVFDKKNSRKGSAFIFSGVLKSTKSSPGFSFLELSDFFSKFFLTKGSPLQFF